MTAPWEDALLGPCSICCCSPTDLFLSFAASRLCVRPTSAVVALGALDALGGCDLPWSGAVPFSRLFRGISPVRLKYHTTSTNLGHRRRPLRFSCTPVPITSCDCCPVLSHTRHTACGFFQCTIDFFAPAPCVPSIRHSGSETWRAGSAWIDSRYDWPQGSPRWS